MMMIDWVKAVEFIEARIEIVRTQLESANSFEEVARLQGEAASYRGLLSLPGQLTGEAFIDDRSEELPPLEEETLYGR